VYREYEIAIRMSKMKLTMN